MRPIWLSRNYGQHPATLAGMASSSGEYDHHLQTRTGSTTRPTSDASSRRTHRERAARLRRAHQRAAARRPAQLRLQGRQVGLRELPRGRGGADLPELPPHPRRAGSQRRRVCRRGRLPRRGPGLGRRPHLARRRRAARGGWTSLRLQHASTALALLAARAFERHPRPARRQRSRRGLRPGRHPLRALPRHLLSMGRHTPEGWTSNMVLVLLSTGAILFSLGVIAEYIGVAVGMAMGKPPYLIISDPGNGPLGRRPGSREPLDDRGSSPRSRGWWGPGVCSGQHVVAALRGRAALLDVPRVPGATRPRRPRCWPRRRVGCAWRR